MNDAAIKSLTPDLPIYSNARYFLQIMDGVPIALYRSMYSDIWGQRDNPQATASWTDPDSWIPQRLSGEEQALAMRFWRESNHTLNPRYLRGSWYLATKHQLLAEGPGGVLGITIAAGNFLKIRPVPPAPRSIGTKASCSSCTSSPSAALAGAATSCPTMPPTRAPSPAFTAKM
jgi:hypothetical protein